MRRDNIVDERNTTYRGGSDRGNSCDPQILGWVSGIHVVFLFRNFRLIVLYIVLYRRVIKNIVSSAKNELNLVDRKCGPN